MSQPARRVLYTLPVPHQRMFEVLGQRPDIELIPLDQSAPQAAIDPVLASVTGYQVGSARDEIAKPYHVHDAFLARAPKLLVVSTNGAGYDTVDVDACTRAGVLAVNQAGGNAEAVAEHALGLMLVLSKRIVETDRYMRRASGIPRNDYLGHNLLGKTVGIIGLGHVGSRIAELCNGLLRMKVLAFDPYLSAEQIRAKGAEKCELDALLAAADFVSINCPLTRETRNLIGAREFGRMKPSAYFVSTARGSIHDEAALTEALRAKTIAGAGLDVWEQEPPPHTHPLMSFDNVMVSPHTAGVTEESRSNITTIAAEQLIGILDGRKPPRLLNPQVWPAYRERFARVMGFAADA